MGSYSLMGRGNFQGRETDSKVLGLPSMCGGDAVFCQITLTICFISYTTQVDLSRSFVFRNSGRTYDGIPIMASNMDTIGTFQMAKKLSKVRFITDGLTYTVN